MAAHAAQHSQCLPLEWVTAPGHHHRCARRRTGHRLGRGASTLAPGVPSVPTAAPIFWALSHGSALHRRRARHTPGSSRRHPQQHRRDCTPGSAGAPHNASHKTSRHIPWPLVVAGADAAAVPRMARRAVGAIPPVGRRQSNIGVDHLGPPAPRTPGTGPLRHRYATAVLASRRCRRPGPAVPPGSSAPRRSQRPRRGAAPQRPGQHCPGPGPSARNAGQPGHPWRGSPRLARSAPRSMSRPAGRSARQPTLRPSRCMPSWHRRQTQGPPPRTG